MNIGDVVVVNKCDQCSVIVGKSYKVKGFAPLASGEDGVVLNFGRGRPPANRPGIINKGDVSVVVVE